MKFLIGFLTVLLVTVARFSFTKAAPATSCASLYESPKDKWLKGETTPVGFPFQFLAIFSFAPMAFALQTNLVLGDVYRTPTKNVTAYHQNFTRGNKNNLHPSPFSTFFDAKHFTEYWSHHKLQVLTSHLYYFCFQHGSSKFKHEEIFLQRNPPLQSISNREVGSFLASNKAKFPFPNHHLIQIEGKYKMIGLFNFWNHSALLNYAYQSIQPAVPIVKFSAALQKVLTRSFITIHLRVDEEAFPSSILPPNNEQENEKSPELLGMLNHLKFSSCFNDLQHLNHELFIDPPSLYLITNARANSRVDRRKVKYIIEQLMALGFVNIYTRKRIIDRYLRSTATNQWNALGMEGNLHDLSLYRALSIEQLQYVDLILGTKSICFIPSQRPTFLSYLIKRMLALENRVPETYDTINETTYGDLVVYKSWGL